MQSTNQKSKNKNIKKLNTVRSQGEVILTLSQHILYLENSIKEMKDVWEVLIDKYENHIADLIITSDNNYKVATQNGEVAEKNAKAYYEMTRAYNALAQFGKFAEELGIDIKKHNAELPENKYKDFEFDIGQKVGESGKVTSFVSLRNPKTKEEFKIKMQNNEKKPKDPQSQPKVKQEDEPNE